jgi:hypothetical protein
MEPNTWNEACRQALSEISLTHKYMNVIPKNKTASELLDKISESLGEFVRSGDRDTLGALGAMVMASHIAIQELDLRGVEMDWDGMHELLCQKQHDYGHQNIDNFGLVGVAVRLCDKIARAENLKNREANAVSDETIMDTYEDIIGYTVIAMMLDADTFRLELELDSRDV